MEAAPVEEDDMNDDEGGAVDENCVDDENALAVFAAVMVFVAATVVDSVLAVFAGAGIEEENERDCDRDCD